MTPPCVRPPSPWPSPAAPRASPPWQPVARSGVGAAPSPSPRPRPASGGSPPPLHLHSASGAWRWCVLCRWQSCAAYDLGSRPICDECWSGPYGILRVLINRRAQRRRLHHSLTISRGVPQNAGASGTGWIVADRPGPVPGSGCGRGAAGSGSPAPSGGTTSIQSARRARGTAGSAGRRSPIPGTRSSSPLLPRTSRGAFSAGLQDGIGDTAHASAWPATCCAEPPSARPVR